MLALGLEVIHHKGAGAPRGEEFDPLRLRLGILGRNNLHFVAGFEHMAQLYQALVHLGRDGLVTHFRMDEIGKIQGGGPFLDAALVSLRGEDVYLGGG